MTEPTPDDWTEEDRFADYRQAYSYARTHFTAAAHAHAKVNRREAYWIWSSIQRGFEQEAREQEFEQLAALPQADSRPAPQAWKDETCGRDGIIAAFCPCDRPDVPGLPTLDWCPRCEATVGDVRYCQESSDLERCGLCHARLTVAPVVAASPEVQETGQ